MSERNALIRYAIARDQFDNEIETHFRLAHYGLAAGMNFPTARMKFWDEIMRRQLEMGWRNFAR